MLTVLQEPLLNKFHLAVYFILTDEMSRAITGSLCPYNDRKNCEVERKTVNFLLIFCSIQYTMTTMATGAILHNITSHDSL